MKTIFYSLFIISSCALVNCASMRGSQGDLSAMEGWHFHVCSNETKASRVWFEVSGTSGTSTYESSQLKWSAGKSTFIAVPEKLRHSEDLNLSIRTSGKRKAKVCVLYGTYIIKSVEVSGTETNKLKKDFRDECPC
jgi:hypothetical protein